MKLIFITIILLISIWGSFGKIIRGQRGLLPPKVERGTSLPSALWFDQKLDHFNPTDLREWKQRYYVNDAFYETGGPLFVMIGGEGPISPKWMANGSWVNYGQTFKAYLVQIEHRYYGESHPTPDMSSENLKYLSSEQALADLAYFLTKFKKSQHLEHSKVIVFGGSYPGSLAAWVRLKYPHIVHGAVSSSAPLLAQINFKEYLEVVDASLRAKGSEECVKSIRKANQYISLLLEHPLGLKTLEQKLRLCQPLDVTNEKDVSNLFEILTEIIDFVVQYNGDNRHFDKPQQEDLTITSVCDVMTNASLGNAFERYATVNSIWLNITQEKCLNHTYKAMIDNLRVQEWTKNSSAGGRQWIYQTCTEFGFYQTSDSEQQPFGSEFSLDFFLQQCSDIYGKKFTYDLLKQGVDRTNIMYGGKDPQITRVVLVNGSIDPWHYLGLTNSTNPDIPTIFINGTAHCANMYPERDEDNQELKDARKKIEEYIGQWLEE